MDKIWYRNPSNSEVIGRCGGDEKNEWPRRTDKSRTLTKNKKTMEYSRVISEYVHLGGKAYLFAKSNFDVNIFNLKLLSRLFSSKHLAFGASKVVFTADEP